MAATTSAALQRTVAQFLTNSSRPTARPQAPLFRGAASLIMFLQSTAVPRLPTAP
jgi:hypothetical protein